MKQKKFFGMLLCMLIGIFALTSCGGDDKDDEPEVPDTPESPIVGSWEGTVYYKNEGASEYYWTRLELGSDGSYRDYNDDGVLIGSGRYMYDGTTIIVPDGSYVANNWGRTYTVTINGSNMVWVNDEMKHTFGGGAEYRFTKK